MRMLLSLKVGVVVVHVVLGVLVVSSAGAAEWHTNGHRTFSSTNAGAWRLAVHNGSSTVLVECASATLTGTLRGPTIAGSTVSGIATVTPVFGGPCTVSGTPGFSVTCSAGEVNAVGYSGGTTFATAGTGTAHVVRTEHCTLSAAGTPCSTSSGSSTNVYTNPHILGGNNSGGQFVVGTAGQRLEVTKIGAGCVAIPNGTGTFGKPGPGSTVTPISYVVDGPNAPWMFRTP
jgi:hypothetical protein